MELSIKGLLGIDSLSLVFKTLINIIVGVNEAGKSSIRDAIKLCLTGTARNLVTHNEQAALIRDGAKAAEVNISLPSGKITLKKTPRTPRTADGPVPVKKEDREMAAIACDPLLFLSLPEKIRREIIFRMIPGLNLSQEDIGSRLAGLLSAEDPKQPLKELEKLAVGKLAGIAASEGFKAAEIEAVARRREAKAVLKDAKVEEPKQMVMVGDTEFILPDYKEAELIKGLERLQKSRDDLLQKKGKAAGEYEAEMDKLPELQKELAALDAHPLKPPEPGEIKQLQSAIDAKRPTVEDFQKQIGIMESYNAPKSFPAICPAFSGFEIPCGKARQEAVAGKKAEAPSRIEKVRGFLKIQQEEMERLEKDLQEAQAKAHYPQKRQDLAEKIDNLRAQATIKVQLDEEIAVLDAAIKNAQELLGAVRSFCKEKDAFDAAAVKLSTADKEALLYDVLAKALAPEGIPSRMISEALAPMNDLLQLAAVHLFPGRTLILNKDLGIELSGKPYVILSKSAKFRVGVAFQYALAKLAGAPLLMIDEADILDAQNRGKLINFARSIKKDFYKILVFATSDCARASQSPDIQVWVLSQGKIEPLNQGFTFKAGKIIPDEEAAQKMAA